MLPRRYLDLIDGCLLPHVIDPSTLAKAVADIIRSGIAELDLVEA